MVISASARDMLASLLRPGAQSSTGRRRLDSSLYDSNPNSPGPDRDRRDYLERRHATADFTEADDDDDETNDDNDDEDGTEHGAASRPRFARFRPADANGSTPGAGSGGPAHGTHDADRQRSSNTAIPLFSASHLDSLPIYSIVHGIRIIVQTRTETTLTWDQLRSPQVSQFLVKPMQQTIRTQHFTRATLYALMANCLQFAKEGELYPGNAGTSYTRARVCELLALKLLKEYNTRELIDALSYDFYPLQGLPNTPSAHRGKPAVARTSTLEVAIRASAKHFLSHPLVVQQLEAIWNGAISFYSSADALHRAPPAERTNGGGGGANPAKRGPADARTPLLSFAAPELDVNDLPLHAVPIRRTVALYDPRNASPFKLSRLRVPRYRQFLSTCSLFLLICLYLAVLVERSSRITSLELVFWFWSAGFMLDEVVGFNEQGFSLYIMSFWNIFDLGILLLLIIYYCMRVYGIFLVDPHVWNDMAYDVLATNAILLLPRIFSVLDHYRYFSQLLIAFRLMAVDVAAVFILIMISCSGFFVFFTLSKNNNDAGDVAYKIFQILMGFTPAAWDVWPEYNFLGRILLGFFLVICHFVVVTILITVLTNSFMAIASNANQEHQFLFAINTISMVKNDALFSYVAPGNIFAWVVMPLRYVMPIREFVALNRWIIKLTHWPLLFSIFIYEKYFLASRLYEPTDLVENSGRTRTRAISFADPASRSALFSPNLRAREESGVGIQKDRALDEVFRHPPGPGTLRFQRRQERRQSQTAIRDWMDQNMDEDDAEMGEPLTHWPTMDSRLSGSHRLHRRLRHLSDGRSVASDPADMQSHTGFSQGGFGRYSMRQQQEQTDVDADGDDELVTNDEDEDENVATKSETHEEEDYFTTPVASRFTTMVPSSVSSRPSITSPRRLNASMSPRGGQSRRQGMHSRTISTNTILYAPQEMARKMASPPPAPEQPIASRSRPKTGQLNKVMSPLARSPKKAVPAMNAAAAAAARPRPIPAHAAHTAPNRPSLLGLERRLSSDMGVDLASDLGADPNLFGAVPSSFQTQMALATGQLKGLGRGASSHHERESADRMTKLVLARMKTLEEGLADVVREMRIARSTMPTAHNSAEERDTTGSRTSRTSPLSTDVGGTGALPPKRRPPVSRRLTKSSRPPSIKEERGAIPAGPRPPRSSRGHNKGKEVAHSSQDESENSTRGLRPRGTSF